jgi:hypothetical protein
MSDEHFHIRQVRIHILNLRSMGFDLVLALCILVPMLN